MKDAFIVDGVRTAIGNFGGSLSVVRTDDMAAFVLKKLMEKKMTFQGKAKKVLTKKGLMQKRLKHKRPNVKDQML